MDIKLTAEERKELGGMLPWDPDAKAPFIPPQCVGKKVEPTFFVRDYSKEQMRRRSELLDTEGKSPAESFAELFAEGAGLVGWENYVIPFTAENIKNLPGKLIMQIDAECMLYTVGPKPLEK